MKLIVITQKVDSEDSNLGFFYDWLEKMAEKCEKILVICQAEGKHDLPSNVVVFSLGKEMSYSKLKRLLRLQKFLWQNLRNVDGIFCHMCPIFVLLSWPLTMVFRKKIILWFVHRNVGWKLKVAEKMVSQILTASEQSCQLKNRKKIQIIGHGIDTQQFTNSTVKNPPPVSSPFSRGRIEEGVRLLFVGRISPIKGLEILIGAMDVLVNQKNRKDFVLKIAGEGIDRGEKLYEQDIRQIVQDRGLVGFVEFLGPLKHQAMPNFYCQGDVLINLCPTGGLDKAILEAMACNCWVLTSNQSFVEILPKECLVARNAESVAQKILDFSVNPPSKNLREIVVKNHNLDNLIDKIIQYFNYAENKRFAKN